MKKAYIFSVLTTIVVPNIGVPYHSRSLIDNSFLAKYGFRVYEDPQCNVKLPV